MEKHAVILQPPKMGDFLYGGCATLAFAGAFDTPPQAIKIIISLMGIRNSHKGMTFDQCKKVIYKLSREFSKKVEYKTNPTKLNYVDFAYSHKFGRYLIIFDEHLSYMEDGVIYDGFFEKEELDRKIPTGWWKLTTNIRYKK
jgi:hypothetical protein